LLYADHHATTPVAPEVQAAMAPWLAFAANASAVHSPGRAARNAVEEARSEVARLLGASPGEIVFTSGGTEADNLAVRGGSLAARESDPGRHRVLVTKAEHPAVREAARSLLPLGFEMLELPVDSSGLPRPGDFEEACSSGTALVSAILANNETGVVNTRLPALAEKARKAGALAHTDAVQAVGKIPVDVGALGVDLLSLTGHKFGGPKGAGALFVRKGVRVVPQQVGGGQEKGRRAGTENVAALVGLGAAARVATGRLASEAARLGALRDRFEAGLRAAIPGLSVNGAGPGIVRLPTVTSAVLSGAEGEILLAALDLEGIAASSGSACAAGTTKPSTVLLATGLSPGEVRSTLRFSFGRTTREEDVDRLLEAVPRLWARAAGVIVT
jgi:cysteine desulfurase